MPNPSLKNEKLYRELRKDGDSKDKLINKIRNH